MMDVIILLPSEILLKSKASKVHAEATNGHFTLLIKHIDFVAPLITSILILIGEKKDVYVAVDGGVLVKKGTDVWISTPRAMVDHDLDRLEQHIEDQWATIRQAEKKAKTAMAKLESDAIRRFVEWGKD
jgi:F-type H+-transporting ATPase subunit epsilon